MITGETGADAARNLELHVDLTDRDLLRRARRRGLAGRSARHRCVLAGFRHAADEEAALVDQGDGAAHEALGAAAGRGWKGRGGQQDGRGKLLRGMRRTSSGALAAAQHDTGRAVPEMPRGGAGGRRRPLPTGLAVSRAPSTEPTTPARQLFRAVATGARRRSP